MSTVTLSDRLDQITRICEDAPKPNELGTLADFENRFNDCEDRFAEILEIVRKIQAQELGQ